MNNSEYIETFESIFPLEEDCYLIELRLSDLDQFFNTFDPSPFHKKDIDDDAERYIVNSVRAFSLKTKLKLVFYLPAEHHKEASQVLMPAIENYFKYQAIMASRELKSLLHEGRIAMLLGTLFLCICMSARALLSLIVENPFWGIIIEGLSIVGWVAMWRPIQIYLYDWWALFRKKKVFEKIREMPIEICVE